MKKVGMVLWWEMSKEDISGIYATIEKKFASIYK